jgi:hypothetical protein
VSRLLFKDVRAGSCPRNNLALYDRYELVELRRDDGIQTFHAREIATARPVQLHLFAPEKSRDNLALLVRLDHLPEAERRRVIERGEYQGRPYVITDRLAGYPGFREWLTAMTDPPVKNSSLDEQFLQLFDAPAISDWKATAPTNVRPDTQELDRQFFQLFHPDADLDADTLWLTMRVPAATDRLPTGPVKIAARSLVGIVLGIVAAILVLGLLVAVAAFRPW